MSVEAGPAGVALEGAVILITGAGSGIGRASAELAVRAGARGVVLADLDGPSLDQTAALIGAFDARAELRLVTGSVADPGLAGRLVQKAHDSFGRLDGALNNAGVRGVVTPLVDMDDEQWREVIEVNLTAAFRGVREQLRYMTQQGYGAIVNVASAAVLRATARMAAYTASKAGVIGLTKVAALEAGPYGVRVNALCPGRTDTPMLGGGTVSAAERQDRFARDIPLGRLGTPSELAAAALWLLSPAAAFVNGTTLTVDGGRSAG